MFENGTLGNKIFTVFGGVNGVGKSTYRNSTGVSNFIIDLDDLSRSSFGSYKKALIKEKELEKFFLDNKLSFGRETTLTGKTIFRKISNVKQNGYDINLIFIDVDDVSICIDRIEKRVKDGGHNIPTSDVVRRYSNIYYELFSHIELFDSILFIDNSTGMNRAVCFYNGKEFTFLNTLEKDINNSTSVYNRIKNSIDKDFYRR